MILTSTDLSHLPRAVDRPTTNKVYRNSPCRKTHKKKQILFSGTSRKQTVAQYGPSMSAAQSITVHDGLLHPHFRHWSSPASAGWQVTPHHSTCQTAASTPQTSPASAVRRLPSAVRTATPAFHVRSSGLFCSRPGGLELVTRLPARSVTFLRQFSPRPENFSRFTSVHSALEALLYALYRPYWH